MARENEIWALRRTQGAASAREVRAVRVMVCGAKVRRGKGARHL
jgi:hypothetical protein